MTDIHPMIEKCARAMYGTHAYESFPDDDPRWFSKKEAHEDVIAVLRTLRTPDEGMRMRGSASDFTRMIDSILPEEKGTET